MPQVVRQTLGLLRAQLPALLIILATCNLPYYALYKGAVYWGWLPDQAAEVLFGFVALFLGLLTNAAIVHLLHKSRLGLPETLPAALRRGVQVFPNMLAAYMALSFVVLGWLAVTVLPGAGLMMLLKQQNPFFLVPFGLVGLLIAYPPYVYLDCFLVVEGLEAWRARQASRTLARGQRLAIATYALVAFPPAVALELAADYLPAYVPAIFPGADLFAAIGLGVLSSALYFVPVALFYVLYAEVNFPKAHEEKSL